jgi:3'-5' exoribonuclease
MKTPLVSDLKPNEPVTALFLVQAKEIRQKRTGEPYLSMTLSDRSGELDAKMWDNVTEVMDTFERDDFVKVKGLFQLYNNRPQFTIHKIRPVRDHEVDFSDFFPASARDAAEMWAELRRIVSGISNTHLRALLNAFLDDPEIAERYRIAPAAKTIHHAFRSGLLEHVLSLCGLAKVVGPHYPNIDTDLLLTGVVLHDIGKIQELTYERGFAYSTEGQLIGHISLAMRMMADKLQALPGFPPALRNLVEHMILSHHGLLEYGSPKVPSFPEALLLHHLDDMDSKMENMRALVARDPQAEGLFTGYSSSLARVALRKERYLNPAESCPAPSSAPEAGLPPAPVVHSVAASQMNSGVASAVVAPPKPKPAPASDSLFGEKLSLALNFDRK